MCSNIFLLLAVYCVVVSGAKVDLHVKNVNPEYTTLAFVDVEGTTKEFSLGTAATSGNNIQIKSGDIISETNLELQFAPKAAAILPVSAASAIEVKKDDATCAAGKNCFKATAGTSYFLHVGGVHADHKTMICSPKPGDDGNQAKQFNLITSGQPADDKILVQKTIIHELALPITFPLEKCVISATASSGPAPIVILPTSDNCIDNTKPCLKENKATTALHVSGVYKSQTKLIFTGTTDAETQEFTLDEEGTTNDKIIKVTDKGVINEKTVPLTLEPKSCEVKEVSELKWIPIIESAECATGSKNCFKNKVESGQGATSFAASNKSIKLILVAVCLVLGKL